MSPKQQTKDELIADGWQPGTLSYIPDAKTVLEGACPRCNASESLEPEIWHKRGEIPRYFTECSKCGEWEPF